jgi:hypothetical protein
LDWFYSFRESGLKSRDKKGRPMAALFTST